MTLRREIGLAALAALATALSACAGGSARQGPPATATPASVTADDLDAIVALLEKGEEDAARKRLKTVLKRDPMNATARLLKESIEADPRELLGPDSYAYRVKPGDTLSGLSLRLLGNQLKWYQLGRYNGLKAPFVLAPGQQLRIPGQPPAPPAPAPRPRDPVRGAADAPPAPRPSAKPAAPPAQQPVADPAGARAARAAGLAALNQGHVARAVQQLRRAAALDPGNALVARDLARAERIARTVRAGK